MSKIILKLKKSETPVANNTQYRLDIESMSTDPSLINTLLVVRRSANVNTQPIDQIYDQFYGVCRLTDVTTLGISAPREGELFYLTDNWTLIFGHPATRDEAITALKKDAQSLAREIKSFYSPEIEVEEVYEVDY
tara:strand:+ start:223 stop:627 length:405 start_codon:yes stop_codon:yes gene_type:complete